MSAKLHACKDCKWIHSPSPYGCSRTCEVKLDGYYFNYLDGPTRKTKFFICDEQNKEISCKYFKPSLLARFLTIFGRKYEHAS
jgi:hypothetical protein